MARKKTASLSEDAPLEERLVAKLGPTAARLASSPLQSDVSDYISTQCALLDYAIGRPGIPVGRLTVLYGQEGSGKSTLAYHLLVETQRRGGLGILIDTEHRYSRDRGERIGLDPASLVVETPQTMEEMFKSVEETINYIREEDRSRLVCIVIDSLAAIPTQKRLETAIDESMSMGLAARTVSQELTRLHPLVTQHRIALVIVNQWRSYLNISGDPRSKERRKVMGNKTMIGEGALVFWGSLFVCLSSVALIGPLDDPTGVTVRAWIRKSSIAPEGRRVEFDISPLQGIDVVGTKLALLEKVGIVTRAGSWYSLDGAEAKFQRPQFGTVLAEHPELEDCIRKAPELWLESA